MRTSLIALAAGIALGSSSCCFLGISTDCNPPCSVQAVASTSDQKDLSQEINADLTKLAAAPVSADLKNDIKTNTENKFQPVSNKNEACFMLIEASMCAQQLGNKDIADEYIGIVRDQHECQAGLSQMGISFTPH